ncbi:MAG: lipopolysaccharide biosynthesis protein [Cryomorphaceae bacterium]
MIKDLKRTFGQSAVYGLGNVLVKATGLILLPIYLDALSTDAYGMLVLFEVITQFMVGVFSFRLQSSLLRFGSEVDEGEAVKRIYFTATASMFVIAALIFAAFWPLGPLVNQLIFEGEARVSIFLVLFASVALEMLLLMPLQLCRLKEAPVKYTAFLSLKLIGMLGFVSYFVLVEDLGVYGAILGIFWANAVTLLATVPMQIRNMLPRFDKAVAIEMFRFGTPLIFTSISAILLSIGDRVIIKIFGDFSEVGVYGLAYKIGSVVNLLVINSFSLGFLPVAFKKYGTPGFERFFAKTLTYFCMVTVLLTLGVSLYSKELIKILSKDEPEYWIAVVLVPFIAFTFVFKAIQFFISITFHLTKRTRYDAVVTMAGFGLNIALNFALIPFYGMYGAIAATGLSYIGMGWLTHRYAQRLFPVQFESGKIAILILSCAAFIGAGMAINGFDLWVRLIGKTAIACGYLLFLYKVVAGKAEKEKMHKVWTLLRGKGGVMAMLEEMRK